MRLILVFSILLSPPLFAQIESLQSSIDSLTNAITGLQTAIDTTGSDIKDFYSLAQNNLQPIQNSLSQAANALETIANLTVTVQKNQNAIVFSLIGSLAAGIVIGILAANHLFILDGDKNAFVRLLRFARRACSPNLVMSTNNPGIIPL